MRVRTKFCWVGWFSRVVSAFFLLVMVASVVASAQAGPQLSYSSAKAGPNHGWANSSTQGAAITIWGRNFGTSRGSNYVTVAGVNLTQASAYGEWGATTNPTTAKGFQRITFWLNSSMPVGATTITVTVGGVTSNTLPFTIDNTASSNIRFVDPVNGSESYDGQYPDHSLGGSHGPWLYPLTGNTTSAHPGEFVPGAFIYMRGGTYTSLCTAGDGYYCPYGAPIGNPSQNPDWTLAWYSGPLNGTDPLRITLTEYPGEYAHWFDVFVQLTSNYWTMTNFALDGDTAYETTRGNIYYAITVGFPAQYCDKSRYDVIGDQLIGLAFIGNMHMSAQIWGLNHTYLANFVSNLPTVQGLGIDDSYNLYLPSGDSMLVKDNEFHNGARHSIHLFDEHRDDCYHVTTHYDVHRGMTNFTIDSNLFDLNYHSPEQSGCTLGNPLSPGHCVKTDAIIVGLDFPGGFTPPDGVGDKGYISNIIIRNNVFYQTSGVHVDPTLTAVVMAQVSSQDANTIWNGFKFDNNTVYGLQVGATSEDFTKIIPTNMEFKDNIFSNIATDHWTSTSNGNVTPVWSYNLTDKALSTTGAITNQGNNVVANPLFVTPGSDFHIQTSSPAKGAGVAISGITLDHVALIRPTPPSIGAYEFAAGVAARPSPPTGLTGVVH